MKSQKHRSSRREATLAVGAPSREQIEHALRERIKELECLYAISSLREQHRTPERFLQAIAHRLPQSWQFPEFASARIAYDGRHYLSSAFQEGPWRMSADFRGDDGCVLGIVELFYARGVPACPDGPFLREEQALINAVADRLSSLMIRVKTETELADAHKLLRSQHQALQESNITLKTVLSRLEEEKRELRATVLSNIQKLIMPIVFELELAVTGRQRSYVTLLRQSLQEIASPFLAQLAKDHVDLTPVEVAISTMIRNGLSTKEIAQLRCITPATVRRHRENIRRKLGLTNRRANLATYLQGSGGEEKAVLPESSSVVFRTGDPGARDGQSSV